MAATSASSARSSLDVETERGADNTFAATTSRHRVPLQLEPGNWFSGSISHIYTRHTSEYIKYTCEAHQKYTMLRQRGSTRMITSHNHQPKRFIIWTRIEIYQRSNQKTSSNKWET